MTAFIEKFSLYVQSKGNESAAARDLGVVTSHVHRWLKGETRPVGRNLIKLKQAIPGLTDEDVYPDLAAPSAPAAESKPAA